MNQATARRQDKPCWKTACNGRVPENAVEIDRNLINDEVEFVGRAKIIGDLVPGRVIPSKRVRSVGCEMKERCEPNFEVLVNAGNCHLEWVSAFDGKVPAGAIEAGRVLQTGEPLFIGRSYLLCRQDGIGSSNSSSKALRYYGGKVYPSRGCLYVPYDGKEVACRHYQVLCQKYIFA